MIFRTNRWALHEILVRDLDAGRFPSMAAIARDVKAAPSTLTDVLKGRRDASRELLDRVAQTIRIDVRAILADPMGLLAAMQRVIDSATQLAPHLNGHDFGLRQALADLAAFLEKEN